jgi:hypothetical protein
MMAVSADRRMALPAAEEAAMSSDTRNGPGLETPEYSVAFDPAGRMVRIALRGHWDLDLSKRYVREFRDALRVMPAGGCPLGEQLVFVDLREFAVQSQDVLGVLGELSNDASIAPRRTAVVASSALLTMQARRVAPDYHLFADPQEAMAWLTAA